MTISPNNWSAEAWQLFFAAMAIWNFGAALPGLVAPRRGFRLLYGADAEHFYERYQHWAISAVVLLFGVGYAVVALEPSANLGLILLGILGKLLFGAMISVLFFMRRATKLALSIAAGDLVFAGLFLYYLSGSVMFVPELVG